MSRDAFGCYVHVPYCATLCAYCDFNSVVEPAPPWHRYAATVLKELDTRHTAFPGLLARSVYFGGGTPSLAPVEILAAILGGVCRHFELGPGAEITVEVNPGTMGADGLGGLKEMGVNRLSVGWQSTHDHLLRVLGRSHDAAQSRAVIETARAVGFDNLSVDLIFGVPGQTLTELDTDLDRVLRLDVEHISLYALTYHVGTELWRRFEAGELEAADEDLEATMLERIDARLTRAGYEHYEVSNYARPGKRAVHNVLYWTGARYLGLGPGAHSFAHEDWQRGYRWENRCDPQAYYAGWARHARAGRPARKDVRIELFERLSQRQLMTERCMCGLRFIDGIDLEEPVFRGFEKTLEPAIDRAGQRGWIVQEGGRVRPTPDGMRFGDALAALFF